MQAIDPRFNATIPTSAARPVPFTPLVLDAERFRRDAAERLVRRREELDKREDMLRRVRAGEPVPFDPAEYDMDLEQASIAVDRASIDTEAEGVAAEYERIAAAVKTKPVFWIQQPTSIEREQINSRLVQMGLQAVSREQIRAAIIEAVYEHDWGARTVVDGVSVVDLAGNEAIADEHASLLDSVWQREEVQNKAQAQWEEQELERVLDIAATAPARPRAARPPRIIPIRDEAKATLIVHEIQEHSQRLRNMTAKQFDYNRQNAVLLVRMNVVTVDGLEIQPPVTRDALDDALTNNDALAIQSQMEKLYGAQRGAAAWAQLVQYIDRLYSLEDFEVKNSVSPPANANDQSGSNAASGDTGTSGGPSKTSSSDPAPAAESATTIDRSSTSISGSGPMIPDEKRSPMVAP